MSLSHLSNDEVASGLRDHLREAEARVADHPVLAGMLKAIHRLFDVAQRIALNDGQVTTLAGGEKGP